MLSLLASASTEQVEAAQDVTVVATTLLLLAGGASLLKQSGCRRRKDSKVDEAPQINWRKTANFERRYSQTDVVDDAQTCWNFDYGRYKYTGLRPEPLEEAEPPHPLTLEDADQLQLPELREGEDVKLQEMEDLVEDLRLQRRHRVDRCTLLRFLRAEKGKVVKANKKMREAIAWIEENDVLNAIDTWNLEAYEKCLAPWWLSGGFLGHGLHGEPVALERLGRCSWPKLSNRLDFEVLKKLDIIHCRRCLAALEEDSVRRGVPFSGVTLVIDLKGFKWSDAQFSAAWTLSKMVACRSHLLPETCHRILFVRVPTPFAKAWSMFSYLLDPGTIAKVQMATESETISLLRKFIGDEVIPAYLGGQRHTEGDPYCRKLLAPGGFPRRKRFKGWKGSSQEMMSIGRHIAEVKRFKALKVLGVAPFVQCNDFKSHFRKTMRSDRQQGYCLGTFCCGHGMTWLLHCYSFDSTNCDDLELIRVDSKFTGGNNLAISLVTLLQL